MCQNRCCCYVWDEGNECNYIKAKIELVRYSLLGTKVAFPVLINIKYKSTVFSHKNACYVNWKKI